jgi:DNA-binding NarL/FixJ family response regulator
MTRIVLVDAMAGVRAGVRWVLAGSGLTVAAEAGSVAEALAAPGEVLVTGLFLPDGTAADLCADTRPVVVFTWLPADERDVDLSAAAAVLRTGSLRAELVQAIRAASAGVSRRHR